MPNKRNLENLQEGAAKKIDLNAQAFNTIIQREYAKALKEIRAKMMVIYEKYSKEGKLTDVEMTKFNRLKNLETELTKTMAKTGKEVTKKMNKYHEVIYNDAFYRYSYSVDQATGVELEWGSPGQIREIEGIRDLAETQYLQAIKSLNANGIKRVNDAIIGGIMQGLSIKQMMKEVKDSLGTSANDAERIIRTETHRLAELAHYEEYKKARRNGVKLRRKLLAVLDTRTRQQSAEMDGDLSNDEGKFQYPNGEWHIPGNTGVAKWDINDRETTIEFIEGYEPRLRRTREDGLIPFKTFREWSNEKKLTDKIYAKKLVI
jgi:SPP1 gp7 family putative phage head morphogenesis protein